MRIYKEEIFGPVLSVERTPDFDTGHSSSTSTNTATAPRSSPATAMPAMR
jgi:acyl-CoA reductase-like NAD-dependent aldehyde dehydrogenase